MKKSVNLFISILVSSQLIVVAFLALAIYHKHKSNAVLGAKAISPIKSEDIVSSKTAKLKHFYELEHNKKLIDNPEWLSQEAAHSINGDGLNDRLDYTPEKPENVYRIITVGDSFTYGAYVNTEKNWTELLEMKLNDSLNCHLQDTIEVVNLGVGGYDIEYEIQRFISRGKKYNPDLVIWFIKDDDFQIINELLLPIEDEIQQEMELTPEKDEYFFQNDMYYPTWQEAMKRLKKQLGEDKILNYQNSLLRQFKNEYSNDLLMYTFYLQDNYERLLKEVFSDKNNFYFYENHKDIYKDGHKLPDGHPNEKGHEVIAADLYTYLTSSSLVPCD